MSRRQQVADRPPACADGSGHPDPGACTCLRAGVVCSPRMGSVRTHEPDDPATPSSAQHSSRGARSDGRSEREVPDDLPTTQVLWCATDGNPSLRLATLAWTILQWQRPVRRSHDARSAGRSGRAIIIRPIGGVAADAIEASSQGVPVSGVAVRRALPGGRAARIRSKCAPGSHAGQRLAVEALMRTPLPAPSDPSCGPRRASALTKAWCGGARQIHADLRGLSTAVSTAACCGRAMRIGSIRL
jgi:hypothetical protein